VHDGWRRGSNASRERREFAEWEAHEVLKKQPQKKGRRREALKMSTNSLISQISSGTTTAASGSFSAETKEPQSFRSNTSQSSMIHCSLVNAIATSDRTGSFRGFYNSPLTFLSRYQESQSFIYDRHKGSHGILACRHPSKPKGCVAD
jgi:hypothetical protein